MLLFSYIGRRKRTKGQVVKQQDNLRKELKIQRVENQKAEDLHAKQLSCLATDTSG